MQDIKSETDNTRSAQSGSDPTGRRPVWRRIVKAVAWTVGGVVVFCVIACVALNLYLTPKRLARIASDYAGRYLDADIDVRRVSFTMWSSFPHFELQVDSAVVVSRRLRRLPNAQRALLPPGCDTLAQFTSLSGSINPFKLLYDRISIPRLHVKGLRLNMVALNDSVNNYDILPDSDPDKPFVMPRFDAGHIYFSDLRPITYYSAATQASALIDLSHASMTARRGDSYSLQLRGRFSLDVRKMRLLRQFPFGFYGKVDVKFFPFRVVFDRYNVSLGNMRSQVDLSMLLGDNNSQLTALHYSVNAFNLMRLFEYLPAEWLPHLRAIRSNASLEASARLTAPYRFSSEALPSFRVDFRVPDSWLSYSLPEADIKVHNIGLDASLMFNGENVDSSLFSIRLLSLAGSGMKVLLRGTVSHIFSTPRVSADVCADADFSRLPGLLPMLSDYGMKGKLKLGVRTSFPLGLIADGRISEIPLRGAATLSDARYSSPDGAVSVESAHTQLRFGRRSGHMAVHADVDRLRLLSKGGCDIRARVLSLDAEVPGLSSAAMMRLKGAIGTLAVSGAGYDAKADAITLAAATSLEKLIAYGPARIPVDLDLSAASASGFAAADSVKVLMKNMKLGGMLSHLRLNATLSGDDMQYSDPVNFAVLRSLRASTRVNLKGIFPESTRGTVVGVLDLMQPYGKLMAGSGRFVSVVYPAITHLDTLDVNYTPARFSLNRLSLRSQDNAMNISGSIDNYRAILPHYQARGAGKVKAALNLDIDTLDINQVAGTRRAGQLLYAAWKKLPPPAAAPVDTGPTPSDFRPLVIPSWLDAAITLTADRCNYTNLRVLDIDAAMRISDGVFRLDSIHAHTDFGAARASAVFAAADPDHMGVSCDVALDTINVVTFFKRFHTLLEMMPQMSNLSGNVSLAASGQFSIFPDMVMELPSLTARITAQGRDLKVHQSKFIHHVCRFLLINTDDDLRIRNMDVRATIHDNQLELYPFIFEINRYRLMMMGENDFAGNLYYHIAVLKSPIPFKFGVNIDGTFSDYGIHFGRPSFRNNRAMRSMQLLQNHKINIVEELRWFASKFMQKAAEADNGAGHLSLVDSAGHRMTNIHDLLLLEPGADALDLYRYDVRNMK